MSGFNLPAVNQTITDVSSTGYITVASVAGFGLLAKVWLVDSGGANNRSGTILVVDEENSQLGIQFDPTGIFGWPIYGLSDVSAYDGGAIFQAPQFVYDRSETSGL